MKFSPILIFALMQSCGSSKFEQSLTSVKPANESDQSEQVASDSISVDSQKATEDALREDSEFLDEKVEVVINEDVDDPTKLEDSRETENPLVISQPIMVLGSYLTQCAVQAGKIVCDLDPSNRFLEEDFEKIIIINENGTIIPKGELKFEIIVIDGVEKLTIYFPENYRVIEIQEDEDLKSNEDNDEHKDDAHEENVEDENESEDENQNENEGEDEKIPENGPELNRNGKVDILELGLSAKITTTKLVQSIGLGGLKVEGNITLNDLTIVKEDYVITINGLESLKMPIDIYYLDGQVEQFTIAELRGESSG